MSEPWAHPERAANQPEQPGGETPERVSISESTQTHSAPQQMTPPTEQVPAQNTGPQPMVDSGPQPTVQMAQPQPANQDYQPTQQYSSEQQQFSGPPGEPQYAQQHHAQPQYVQPQYVPPKKKSGVFGLIGLFLVLFGNVLVFAAVVIGFSNFEFSEEYLEELANANTASLIMLIVAILAWMLGSLVCVISLAARRGVIASTIGLILVLIPSWLVAFALLASAMGSTAMLHLID